MLNKICKSKYQVAYMAPTEILSKQQYVQAKKLFGLTNIKVEILTSKTPNKKTKKKTNAGPKYFRIIDFST